MNLTEILQLKSSDIDKALLQKLFAISPDGKQTINPEQRLILDEKVLKEANSEILSFKDIRNELGKETTIGRIIANLVLYGFSFINYELIQDSKKTTMTAYNNEEVLHDIKPFVKYKNIVLTKGNLSILYNELAELFIDKKINSNAMDNFIDRLNWLGFTLTPYINPSLDILSISPNAEIKKIRRDVFKKYEKEIAENDVVTFNNKVEKEILSQASDILDKEKCSGKLIYDSGVNGSFSTNYKVTSLMRGVVAQSDDPTAYSIATSSLTEGVSKEEVATAGDIAVQGSIGRAISTRQGGYLTKKFHAAFQSIIADKAGTDCGTPYTLDIELTAKNFKDYIFRFIVEGGKTKMIEREDDKYIGKIVRMRTPFYCQNPLVCHKCVGDLVHRLGIRNIGLTSANIGASLLNASLKSFHSLSVKNERFNIKDYIQEAK